MDFNFAEEQTMVRDLARGILDKELTHERLKRIEAQDEWFDRELWSTLAEAGLLGLAVPEDRGGMGFGFLELCTLLAELGRAAAPVPALPTLVLGGLPIAEFGTEEQKRRWLTPLAAGELVLTAALHETAIEGAAPAVAAQRDGDNWVLTGRADLVPAAGFANRVAVPAATEEGTGLFLIDPQASGVRLVRHKVSRGEALFAMEFADARAGGDAVLENGAAGSRQLPWLRERALVALCAVQLGVSERALEMTASYAAEREQFGVPIGSFQAVQHRAADGYIDLEALRWVTWRAAWKLSRGETALRETAVAKFWAAEAGSHIANSAQHLHGGIGVDVDYPLHRYFLWSKALELSLGGGSSHLAALGRDMARTGVRELS